MARTKQTARKAPRGKSTATFPNQTRKVILEYSSDEDGDQRVPGVELGKPKRVQKRITLTLPTKPERSQLHRLTRQIEESVWLPRSGKVYIFQV